MPKPAPRRPLRRRLLFALAGLAIGYGVLELSSVGLYAITYGELLSFARLHAAQARLGGAGDASTDTADTAAAAKGEAFFFPIEIHPYLGYVHDTARNSPVRVRNAGHPISSYGFCDDGPPLHRRASGHLIVAILGGSVADMLARLGDGALERALRRDGRYSGERIELVRLAIGGYKQPQQVLAIDWLLALGGEFDVVINLDGFNEIALPSVENRARGVPPSYPRSWDNITLQAPDPLVRRAIGRIELYEDLRRQLAGTAAAGIWRWSATCGLLWRRLDDTLAAAVTRARTTVHDFGQREVASERSGAVSAEALAADAELWRRTSRLLDERCRARGIRYLHFLQPNQYDPGQKPLSADEKQTAYDVESPYRAVIEAGYPLLREAGKRLRASGVAFHDLSGLFRDHPETLYIDACCHLNARGNELLGEAIAAAILAGDERPAADPPDPAAMRGLRPGRAAYRLQRPFAHAALQVLAEGPDGSWLDVTYAGPEYRCSDPGGLAVDRRGELTARLPGRFTVTASWGRHRIEIPVEVAFPTQADVGGSFSRRRDERPRLRLQSRTDEQLRLRVDGLAIERPGLLRVTSKPVRQALCGGISFAPLEDTRGLPVRVGPEGSTIELPLPAGGGPRTLYLQMLFHDPRLRCPWSLTNGLLVQLP